MSSPSPATAARRPRRHDPDRRDHLVEAALAVVARHGVAGTTARLIAAEADVPLGSVSYHFDGVEDLLACAWRRLADRMAQRYAAHFAAVTDRGGFVDAVTALIHDDAGGDPTEWAASYELYGAALRRPELRELTEAWMQTSRTVLERYVDPLTARGLDALVEGLVMHKILSTRPVPRTETRTLIDRAVADAFHATP